MNRCWAIDVGDDQGPADETACESAPWGWKLAGDRSGRMEVEVDGGHRTLSNTEPQEVEEVYLFLFLLILKCRLQNFVSASVKCITVSTVGIN